MRREKTKISNIRNKSGKITTNTMENQGVTRDYFENYIPINWKILEKRTNF
jgi:hypothetical protein